MLGNDLRIRRFTPQAEKVLNLRPNDLGRPIGDFKPKINVPDLELLFLDAIDNLTIKEREVQDKAGQERPCTESVGREQALNCLTRTVHLHRSTLRIDQPSELRAISDQLAQPSQVTARRPVRASSRIQDMSWFKPENGPRLTTQLWRIEGAGARP